MSPDDVSGYYVNFLDATYRCVDRIVLNAYCAVCCSPGGFRSWWRHWHGGSDADLDTAHLMRLAGRFGRRVQAYAKAHDIRVRYCAPDERKHQLAADYLQKNPTVKGLFLILVSRAYAPVWKVSRSRRGVIRDLTPKRSFVHHYSFHIMDPEWGHLTIKMASHPPFGAQIMLNGHEYVASHASARGIAFTKEGNCFTTIATPTDLAPVAETLSQSETIGRLRQVCERWIYSTCLCFALDLDEQQESGFRYDYSVYQVEASCNLLFHSGRTLEQIFQGIIDRTRTRLQMPQLKTIFGFKARPHRDRKGRPPRLEVSVETLTYDLTIFKLHFGKLTLKAYTKGERVLRFEAIVHNTTELRCGRRVERFPQIVAQLEQILERFMRHLYCMDATFISDATLDQLPTPTSIGKTRVGGIDLNKPRIRAVLQATLALAGAPNGFTVGQLAEQVRSMEVIPDLDYDTRRAAYDLKKLRAKALVTLVPHARRYRLPSEAVRTIGALVILREHVIRPLLAGARTATRRLRPANCAPIDDHYEAIRQETQKLFQDLGIAA